jgi:hypothetical protein
MAGGFFPRPGLMDPSVIESWLAAAGCQLTQLEIEDR